MITDEVFRKSLLKCWIGKVPKSVVVALSGGVDSICLTYLLSRYRDKYDPNLKIHAVTIDHKYRPGSDQEAVKVGNIVKKWNVSHIVKALSYNKDIHNLPSFEELARFKRYETFEDVCLQLNSNLFVAHNLNDQLETFVQRLQGNSSIFGLAGLKKRSVLPVLQREPYRNQILVYRPLLGFDKEDIISTCVKNNVTWFEDVTNKDTSLTRRNYLRHLINDVIPKKRLKDSSLEIITKESLSKSHSEVTDIVENLLSKVSSLKNYFESQGSITVDEKNGKLTISFPTNLLDEKSSMVFSRFLYYSLFPFSSIKHYHWAYAKVERQLVPRLVKHLNEGSEKDLKLTYLNLVFDLTYNREHTLINISRQPIQRNELSEIQREIVISKDWTDWILFDRRFWLRFKQDYESKSITIVPYSYKLHKKMVHPEIANNDVFFKGIDSIPVVISNGQIVALPTHGLYAASELIQGEWYLKRNVYSNDLDDLDDINSTVN
ncbi:PP-loop family-domain-containing protein [Scheffersomyces coipomensis]|uniref:PP-loop family-domain-containing protein n=1 Tax=Scheffersomyces coipomensis TaxID=1788519 RepID=UPI00315D92F0